MRKHFDLQGDRGLGPLAAPSGAQPGAPASPSSFRTTDPTGRCSRMVGLGVLLALVALYNLFFFNRFFPLTEGWFSLYAELLLQGKAPYKDFYLFMPPLYPLQLAAFIAIFGKSVIALRLLGIGVMLLMASMLYLLYARWFPAFSACFAALVSIVYYQSGVAHIPYDFTQFMTVYAIASIFFIVRFCDSSVSGATGKRGPLWLVLGGIMASSCFLTKQSNGAFIFIFSALALFAGALSRGTLCALKAVSIYSSAAAIPVAMTALWLLHRGALVDAVDQIFFGALQSKGDIAHIMWSWTEGLFTPVYAVQFRTILVRLMPLFILNFIVCRSPLAVRPDFLRGPRLNAAMLSIIGLAGACAVSLPFFRPAFSRESLASAGAGLLNYIIVISTASSMLVFLVQSFWVALRLPSMRPGLLAFSIFSMGLVFGNGTSAGIGEISCFLGLGLALGYLLSLRGDLFIGKALIMTIGLSYTVFLVSNKYDRPYAWWSVSQPDVRGPLVPAGIDPLRGIRIEKGQAQLLRDVKALVEAHSAPGDPILAFPHVPFFYLLSDRWPGTPAVVHWFDFLPDGKAYGEARLLLESAPQVIVYLQLPEFVWSSHERLFRHGRPMGQRLMKEAIEDMTSDPRLYVLDGSFPVPDDCVLKIWHRKVPDPAEQNPSQAF